MEQRFALELEYIRTALELIEEGKSNIVYRIADGGDVMKSTADVRIHSDGRSEGYSIAKCLTYVEQMLSVIPVRNER